MEKSRISFLVAAVFLCLAHLCNAQSSTTPPSHSTVSYGVIGDANQDGVFDERDIVLVEESLSGTSRLPEEAAALVDVAQPCDKKINAADLRMLRQALYRRGAGVSANSECHGQAIGTETSAADPENLPTLDEMFVEIAKRVPGFGGAYIDSDGKLAMVLRDPSPQSLSAAQDIFVAMFGKKRIPKAGVKAVKGDFDFLALNDAHERARALLSQPGAVYLDTAERSNRVVVGINGTEAQAAMQKQMAGLGIDASMVTFQQTKPVGNLDFPLSLHQLRHTQRPLLSGLQIDFEGGFFCTLSFVAERSGVPGLITCSHCTQVQGMVDGTAWTQISDLIATETVDPPLFTGGQCPSGRKCRFSDSAFGALAPGVTALRGRISNIGFKLQPGEPFLGPFSFAVTKTVTPIEGATVQKVGRTTGYTYGPVTSTCADVDASENGTDTGITKLCQTVVDAGSGPGDSGSPVWEEGFSDDPFDDPYPASLAGVLWGGPTEGNYFVFSPISAVRKEIGHLTVLEGQDPPTIKVQTPADGAKVGFGAFDKTTFTATTNDLEDGPNCCTVTWRSDKDGLMGTGSTIQFEFDDPGTRTVTATAENSGGKSSADVTIKTVNSPPGATIVQPKANADLVTGVPYKFQGTSFDSETFSPVPCHRLKWTSNNGQDTDFPKSGCNPEFKFSTNGNRTIVLTATDAEGASGSDSVHVQVGPAAPNSKPVVTILAPNENEVLEPNAAFTLKGTATDSGGNSPISYKWVVDLSGGPVTLGTGTSANGGQITQSWMPKTNVPSSCGGSTVKLHLFATDPEGLVGEKTVTVHIPYPVC